MTTRQQERSDATRARLMEATVECLVERGWSGTTTTTVVAQRAGVSRGACCSPTTRSSAARRPGWPRCSPG